MKKIKLAGTKILESMDAEGKDWKVCLLGQGLSKNGFFYSKEVLQKALPLFEGAQARMYEVGSVLKHLPAVVQNLVKEGFPRSIIGWYSGIEYNSFKDADGNVQEGILGTLHIADNAKDMRALLKDAWTAGKKICGLSIDATANVEEAEEEGKLQKNVREILSVLGIDLVDHASAKGAFLRLVAADDDESPVFNLGEKEMKRYLLKLLEMVRGKKPETLSGVDTKNITEAQGAEIFKNAMEIDAAGTLKIVEESVKEDAASDAKAIADKKKKDEEDALAAAEKAKKDKAAGVKESEDVKSVKEGVESVKAIKEDLMKINCAAQLNATLSESKLPAPVQDNIRKQFSGRIFEASELDGVVMSTKDMLAKLSESGDVKGMGGKPSVEVTLQEMDKKQSAMDKLIDPKAVVADKVKNVGAFRGIREAYIAFTGDHSVSGRMSRLTESMQSSDFPDALGVSMTRKMAREYPLLPTTWDKISTVVPLSNFKTQETIRWGGFGRLPVVAEKGSYTDLLGPRDEKATYAPSKKGGLAYVTREMIMNDDLRFLQRLPSALSRAAAETLEYYVWNPILANSTCYDLTALGSAAHANYGTSALDPDTLTAAKLRMRKQVGQGSVLYAGTASTTGSTTTLVDATLSQFVGTTCVGKYLRIIAGTGAGTRTLIASHNTTTLTFAEIASTPDSTSVYQVSAASADDVRLGLLAKFLVCGPDLEATAKIMLQSDRAVGGNNNDVNIHKGTLDIISPLHLTDVNNWFLAADPAMIDLAEVGFIDGQQAPTLLLQDQPANGVVFTNDQIVYKVRHEYGIVIPDFRGWDVNIVA